MDPRFQSSFIPKKPIAASIRPKKGPINILSLIAVLVFIISLAGGGAAFFYQNYLNTQIASDEQSLNLTNGQFDSSTINQIIRLDSRLSTASSLLSAHVELSNLYAALENSTIQTVRFTSFSFAVGDQNTLLLTLDGEGQSFSDVALQSAAFNHTTYFKNLVVSNLTLEQTGNVGFDMTMTVDPSLIAYAAPEGTTTSVATTTSAVNSLSATTTATSTNTQEP